MGDSGKAKQGAERYLTFLAEEGYRPRIDANGNVAFKCEGRSYVEKDEEYFCLSYPNFWRIESDEELSQVTDVFNRCLRALRAGVEKFVAKMQEPPKPDDAFVFHLPRYNVGGN